MASDSSPSSAPQGVLRGWSSQPEPQPARAHSVTLPPTRRQFTQERLDEILETGRERAPAMNYQATSRELSPTTQTRVRSSDHDDALSETTSIVNAQIQRDYQGTQTSSDARSRRRTAQSSSIAEGEGDDSNNEAEKKHWLREYLDNVWTIELENKASVARDHLALERTFLAWLRTSLAFASIGIAITQLFRLNTSLVDGPDNDQFQTLRHIGKPLGTTFIGISVLVLILGYQRYIKSQQWLLNGKFPASRGTIMLVTLIAFMLMVASLIIVVIIQPDLAPSQ